MMDSKEFLYDKFNSGRVRGIVFNENKPRLLWSASLKSFPPKGPESSVVLDSDGNNYFGCHDGVFYSYDNNGKFRWMFNTYSKIYSSPLLYKDKLYFTNGNGYLFCFSLSGELLWHIDITSKKYRSNKAKYIRYVLMLCKNTIKFGFSYNAIYNSGLWKCLSWASPKRIGDSIIIPGAGGVLYSFDCDSGKINWSKALKDGRQILAGVSIDKDNCIIAVSQKHFIHKLNQQGELIWERRMNIRGDIWTTPSVDPDTGNIYLAISNGEKSSFVISMDNRGNTLWQKKIESAIRGCITVMHNKCVACLFFDGSLRILSKEDGSLIAKVRISTEKKRALWTSCVVDDNNNLMIATKDSSKDGSLVCLDKNGNILWRISDVGKALAVPSVDNNGNIYIGSWKGCMNYYGY